MTKTNQKKAYLVRYQEVQYKDVIVWAKDSEEANDIAFNYAYNNDFSPYGDLEFDHWDVDVMREAKVKDLDYYDTLNEEQMEEEREK